jgi:two-component system chemotaxis response regulator CheB
VSYGPRVTGVVLTGLLNDGAAGLAAVKQYGGIAVVQSPADAVADQMPLGALGACDVDYQAPIGEMGELLAKIAGTPAGPPVPVPAGLSLEVEIALGRPADTPAPLTIADPSTFSCPACGGLLSELRDRSPLRFRCQIGHAFTAETLNQKHAEGAEAAPRVALRIIEERVTLMERMVADARAHARSRSTAVYEERNKEYRQHGKAIRQTLLRLKN